MFMILCTEVVDFGQNLTKDTGKLALKYGVEIHVFKALSGGISNLLLLHSLPLPILQSLPCRSSSWIYHLMHIR